MPKFTRWLPGALAVLCGIAVMATPASANASTTSAVTIQSASPQQVIECTAKVNYPHPSTHVPYTVNATGSVTCTSAVTTISFTMYLNESGYEVAQRTFVNDGRSSLSGNVAVDCASGTTHPYQAFLTGEVTFPPGYTPHIEAIGNQSPNINVKCK